MAGTLVTGALRREVARRRAEQRARLMVKIANRTFTHQPSRVDRLARRLVDKAAGRGPRDG